jgi:hypothetical protein
MDGSDLCILTKACHTSYFTKFHEKENAGLIDTNKQITRCLHINKGLNDLNHLR